jgi:hypothetical protein
VALPVVVLLPHEAGRIRLAEDLLPIFHRDPLRESQLPLWDTNYPRKGWGGVIQIQHNIDLVHASS